MRSRLITSPWWIHGLIYWIFFVLLMTPTQIIDGEGGGGWLSAMISAVLVGAIVGVVGGRWTARQWAQWRTAVGGNFSAAELKVIHRATDRGPLPTETTIRGATARAAAYTLKERQDDQVLNVVILVGFIAGLLTIAAVWSPWWLIGVPVFGYAAYETWAEPRRLRARIELLSRDTDSYTA